MRVPLGLAASTIGYLVRKSVSGDQKYPLVMILELPRAYDPARTASERLTVEECLKAVDDCGAPIISICGGEPLLYPEIGRLSSEILGRKKHVYLSTDGTFIRQRLRDFKPTSNIFFNVHLNGLQKTHDICAGREGVFRGAIEGIKVAKAAGFLVTSDTTVYKQTSIEEIAELFAYLQTLGVDGHMISPAYSYVSSTAKEGFMSRTEVREKFRQVGELLARYNILISPVYMEYLRGERELMCTAWGNPSYNSRGWQGPCRPVTDAHHETFEELIANTSWENYGRGRDARCEDCMAGAGYGTSAFIGNSKRLGDTWKMLNWILSGRMGGRKGPELLRSNYQGNDVHSGCASGQRKVSVTSCSDVVPERAAQGNEALRIL